VGQLSVEIAGQQIAYLESPGGRAAKTTAQSSSSTAPIRQRPAAAESRRQAGHWEGDLITGAGQRSAIATLVERKTRYTLPVPLPHGHSAGQVADALISAFGALISCQSRGSVLAGWSAQLASAVARPWTRRSKLRSMLAG
jgi:IS30 family transposase